MTSAYHGTDISSQYLYICECTTSRRKRTEILHLKKRTSEKESQEHSDDSNDSEDIPTTSRRELHSRTGQRDEEKWRRQTKLEKEDNLADDVTN